MRHIPPFESPEINSSVVAIGNFDGVHLGHQQLLALVIDQAKNLNVPSGLLTFTPHPREFFKQSETPLLLTTRKEKLEILSNLGLDFVWEIAFDENLFQLEPKEFFDKYIVSGVNAKSIFVGHDFSFGKNKSGNIETLKMLGHQKQVQIKPQPEFTWAGMPVRSSVIREALVQGELGKANGMLNRVFTIIGTCVPGDARGRTLGFPTANLKFEKHPILPTGVYATATRWPGQAWLKSVTNMGHRPTFGSGQYQIETHILDYSGNCYDQMLEVAFLKHLRSEVSFKSSDELKIQIERDIAATQQVSISELQSIS
jgi:riboflavin kinase/FMN adenylyltransferase